MDYQKQCTCLDTNVIVAHYDLKSVHEPKYLTSGNVLTVDESYRNLALGTVPLILFGTSLDKFNQTIFSRICSNSDFNETFTFNRSTLIIIQYYSLVLAFPRPLAAYPILCVICSYNCVLHIYNVLLN